MAGNKKARKPGSRRVRSFVSTGSLPIIFRTPEAEDQVLKLMPHTELANLRDGHGTEESYWCVSNRISWGSTLASMLSFSFDPAPVLNAAVDALIALHARFKDIGKFVFKAEELRAVGEALSLCDDMHDATSRRQHRDALVKLMATLPEKELAHAA